MIKALNIDYLTDFFFFNLGNFYIIKIEFFSVF